MSPAAGGTHQIPGFGWGNQRTGVGTTDLNGVKGHLNLRAMLVLPDSEP
uniref:Uncharacterized protein n=1 Tax=Anguilla anguilla TaxID=7936 RepID=A0A0E9XGF9_ANGAN